MTKMKLGWCVDVDVVVVVVSDEPRICCRTSKGKLIALAASSRPDKVPTVCGSLMMDDG